MAPRRFTRREFIAAGSLGGGAILASEMVNRAVPARAGLAGPGDALVVARKNGSVADMVASCVNRSGWSLLRRSSDLGHG